MSKFLTIFFIVFSTNVYATESLKESKTKSSFIGIYVGKTKLEIAASTLTRYEGSMLERMINGDIGTETTEDGYIRLDISPMLFAYVVHWLRYNDVDFHSITDAINTYHVADYLILDELKDHIYHWMEVNGSKERKARTWLSKLSKPIATKYQLDDEIPRKLSLTIGTGENDKPNYRISSPVHQLIGGCKYFGDDGKNMLKFVLKEYFNRGHHYNLCYIYMRSTKNVVFTTWIPIRELVTK